MLIRDETVPFDPMEAIIGPENPEITEPFSTGIPELSFKLALKLPLEPTLKQALEELGEDTIIMDTGEPWDDEARDSRPFVRAKSSKNTGSQVCYN